MKSTEKLKTAIITVAIILSCGTANAQRPRHRHHHPYQVVKMVPSPAVTIRISNHFTQKERFKIAMAYLEHHKHLNVRKYAKMTGLTKAAAQAELDAFVADPDTPITAVTRNKKRLYVTRN